MAIATSVHLEWTCVNLWASWGTHGEQNGNNFQVGTPDRTLIGGYLDMDAASTSLVTISNIPPELTTGGYNVYLYALGGVAARGGSYRIVNGDDGITVLKPYLIGNSPTNPTDYTIDLGATITDQGSYLLFTGLTNANIIVQATASVNPGPGTARAPMNAVQLVAIHSPEPSAATGLTLSSNAPGALNLSWTAGAGSSGSLVIMREAALPSRQPLDGVAYTANSVFGSGENLGGTNHVVYTSSGTSLIVSGLSGGRTYFASVYAFSGSGDSINYVLNNPATNSAAGPATLVSVSQQLPSQVRQDEAAQSTVSANFDVGSPADATALATYSSSNTNLLTVNAAGLVRASATNTGSANIIATYQGLSATSTVAVVVAPTAGMIHRYSFNSDVTDSIGGAHGTPQNAVTFTDGQPVLDGAGAYLDLPNNMFTTRTNITFETWVTDVGSLAWARVYDFGNSSLGEDAQGTGTRYMFMALPTGGGILQGSYNSGGGEQTVAMAGRPPVGQPAHLVWVQDGFTRRARMYVNGVQVAINNNFTQTPATVGSTVNDWLGRSQFAADNYFNGSYDEFRVYNDSLTPLQVAINAATGPTNIVTIPGAIQLIRLIVNSNMFIGTAQNGSVRGDFANVTNVPLTTVPPIAYSSSNTNRVTVDANGVITARGIGSANITATYRNQTSVATITVSELALTLDHRYSWNEPDGSTNSFDSIGTAHGTNIGITGVTGNKLILDGIVGDYVALPAGILTNYASVTVETWVTDNANAQWSRVWDFGTGTGSYMMLTEAVGNTGAGGTPPNTGVGGTRFEFEPPGAVGVQNLTIGRLLPLGVERYITVTFDFVTATARLYVDGILQAVRPNINPVATPTGLGNTTQNWLGRSQFGGDLPFNGTINELRIWSGAISPLQVAIDQAAGPDSVVTIPGTLNSITLGASTSMTAGTAQIGYVYGQFANVTNVPLNGVYPIVYTSSDRSVLTVDANGNLIAGLPGTATITATYGSLSASLAITVVETLPSLAHRYSFASDASDSVGGQHGTSFATGNISGGRLNLDGTPTNYIQLPASLLSPYTTVTFEAWANFGANATGTRTLFAFGDTNTPTTSALRMRNSGGTTILSYRPGATEYNANRNSRVRGPIHVAAIYDPPTTTMALYLDGKLVTTNIIVDALSSIFGTHAFIGKALLVTDPTLQGSIDEFRIYSGAPSLQRIRTSQAAGPTNAVLNAGTITSLRLNVENMVQGTLQPPQVFASSATVSNIDLTLTPGIANFTSSDTNVVAISSDGRLRAVNPGTATITATYRGASDTGSVTVVATGPLILTHQYSFNNGPGDSLGVADGKLYGQASVAGGNLVLDGNQSYMELPDFLIGGYPSLTVESWISLLPNGNNTRIFDFGDAFWPNGGGSGNSYLFFTPQNNATQSRLTLSTGLGGAGEIGAENVVSTFTNLQNGARHHVVAVYGTSTASVYIDGNLITNRPVTRALSLVRAEKSWIGKSQWNDPFMLGNIDDLRIYYGEMSGAQVTANFAAGPPADAELTVTLSGGNVEVSWPSAFIGYTLEYRSLVNTGSWNPVAGSTTTNRVILSPSDPTRFFRLRFP